MASVSLMDVECWAFGCCVVLVLALLWACASDEGVNVRINRELPHADERSVFLVATRQKERIASSLEDAGFEVVSDMLDSPYYLRVTLGVSQGSRSCGTLHNVKYALSSRQPVLEMSGKGWTGSCEPNMSAHLYEQLRTENAFEMETRTRPAVGEGPP